MKGKRAFLMILTSLLLVTMACQFSNSVTTNTDAEKTLEAIYIEQTVAAIASENDQNNLETQVALNVQQTVLAQPQVQPATATVVPTEVTQDTPVPQDTATAEPTATQPIVHLLMPSEPGWIHQWWLDTNTKNYANQKRAISGEKYFANQYERPFTSTEMIYQPSVDVTKVEISFDKTFFYVTIYLSGVDPTTNMLNAWYGVEFDTDMDGRGDYLLWAKGTDQTQWTIEEVYVYTDMNNDVGGFQPLQENAPNYTGDSYETTVFSPDLLTDPDAAWVRRNPANANAIQLAVKSVTVGSPSTFLWSGWADNGKANPQNFDYNDFYPNSQAGSPYSNSVYYPVKELELVDNTCRLPFGFEPTGLEPGICWQPTPTPTQPPIPTTTPTLPSSCDCSVSSYQITDEKCCVMCGYIWTDQTNYCITPIY